MKHSITVTQLVDEIKLVALSGNIGERIQKSALTHVFPVGSDWGAYIGARSFRFVPIAYGNYLLSYTLVLNKKQGEWGGQLHAWGLIGSLESFLTESSLRGFTPRDLFINYADSFAADILYDAMLEGLQPLDAQRRNLRFPWWFHVLWRGQKLGFSWQYGNATQWSVVENLMYLTFLKSLRGNRWWRYRKHPRTFSTFTLSVSDPTELIGLPDESKITPIFGFITQMPQ